MKKIIILFVAVLIIGGIYIYAQRNIPAVVSDSVQYESSSISSNRVSNQRGFSFTIPNGWHVWEGYSAASEIQSQEGFTESFESGWTNEQVRGFQSTMDSWTVENAKVIAFTNAETDYTNRDFSEMGKFLSMDIESPETLTYNTTIIFTSPNDVDFNKEETSTEQADSSNIKVSDSGARLIRIKAWSENYDSITIQIPINTPDFNGEVKSLNITKWVKRGDIGAVNTLIDFISKLKINQ